jgi:hypothetical protein
LIVPKKPGRVALARTHYAFGGAFMLDLLIVLILLALAVCLPIPLTALAVVPVAVTAYPSAQIVGAESNVAAKFAENAARSGRTEDEGGPGHAETARCAGGRPVMMAGVAAGVTVLWVVGDVGPARVDSLTVTQVP